MRYQETVRRSIAFLRHTLRRRGQNDGMTWMRLMRLANA